MIVINYVYILDSMPNLSKLKLHLAGKLVPALVVVIVLMAFALGAMWGKLQGVNGTVVPTNQARPAQAAVVGKYKSFDEAIKDVAKQAGVKDSSKLVTCMNSGEKKSVVDADEAEGAGFGVSGTPGFFVNGRFVGGAFPYEVFKELIDKELEGKGSSVSKNYSQSIQGYVTQGSIILIPKQVSVGKASTRGSGKVILVEYSDFQCPFCSRVFPTVQKILSDYDGKVLLAYKHFPLTSIHPHAQKAAEASECARDQDKFWEFHDKLFETQSDWANL